ncbi:MAG: glutamate--tRNA ligase [Sorangiineae bacterium NIC37A_2]|jgi:glutamyl-tRNA synthetase|nr:MAG: glutamate--tRNA ligase [Sorangiineae bacterium NIC37A_2]
MGHNVEQGRPPRVRFAPSPSGYLHIGGARTALFNWLWARKLGGQFLIRIEDTDAERSSMESVKAILDGLTWLGLDWDEGPGVGGPHEPYFQSERKDLYRREVERLIAEGKAYRCYCTKEELDAQREALKAKDPKAQFVYPGTCRDKPDRPDLPHAVRFKSPKDGVTAFEDKVFGTISTPNAQQQDFVLIRPNGLPLYNTAAVIDDHVMGITLVARGRDHIGNTPQQVLLYEALGYPLPEFAHLPMMLSPKGEKLSKRHAAVSVMEYKEKGYTPMGVLNYLARFGWSFGDQEIFSRKELIEKFDWERVNKSDGKFDDKKFADVAFEHLKNPELTDDDTYVRGVLPELVARGIDSPSEERVRAALPLIRERARDLKDAAHHLDFYFRSPPVMDEKALRLLTPEVAPRLVELAARVEASPEFTTSSLEQLFTAEVERTGLKMKDLAQPVRVALSGRTASPGLYDVMIVLGKAESCLRLRAAAELAERQS